MAQEYLRIAREIVARAATPAAYLPEAWKPEPRTALIQCDAASSQHYITLAADDDRGRPMAGTITCRRCGANFNVRAAAFGRTGE